MAGENDKVVDQVASEPDDGLTPEERTQFEQMQTADTAVADAPVDAQPGDDKQIAEGEEKAEPAPADPDSDADDGDDDAGADKTADGEKKAPRRVRFAKYDRDIKERDAEIAKLREENRSREIMQAKLDERMAIINEALTPKQQQQLEDDDPEPDSEQDIFAHNQWLKRQLVKTQKMVGEIRGGVQQQTQQTNVERSYAQDAVRFEREHPDFRQAYNFMLASRVREMGRIRFGKDIAREGVKLTPDQLANIGKSVEAEEMELVSLAIQNQASPAEMIYDLALARGYTPKQAQAAADDAGGEVEKVAAKVNGKDTNGAAQPSVREEIERVKRGVESSVSLSGGGGAPARALTPTTLANMTQDEFNELMDSLPEHEQRRAMGG